MRVEIFDVEHGQCSLLTTAQGGRVLVDCGHNGTTGWRPSTHLYRLGVNHLEHLLVTNFDEDHVSDLPNIRRLMTIGILEKNPTVRATDLVHLKSQHGAGAGIMTLCKMMGDYGQPVMAWPRTDEIRITSFYNRYPADFIDENNLSCISVIECHNLVMCFTGDMTRAGWLKLIQDNPQFVRMLASINVFFASHHGRQDGCCQELYDLGLNPVVTIISDSGIQYATQETVAWYRQRSIGFALDGVHRRVLTTRRDGRITIEATATATTVATEYGPVVMA